MAVGQAELETALFDVVGALGESQGGLAQVYLPFGFVEVARGVADLADDLPALLLAGDAALLKGDTRLVEAGATLAAVDQRQGHLDIDAPPVALEVAADIADLAASASQASASPRTKRIIL